MIKHTDDQTPVLYLLAGNSDLVEGGEYDYLFIGAEAPEDMEQFTELFDDTETLGKRVCAFVKDNFGIDTLTTFGFVIGDKAQILNPETMYFEEDIDAYSAYLDVIYDSVAYDTIQ